MLPLPWAAAEDPEGYLSYGGVPSEKHGVKTTIQAP